MMLLPKFLGILPFAQANKGAGDAAAELKNSTALAFVGPTADNSVQGQIEFVTNAATQGYKVVMISNNAGDQIAPAAAAAQAAGVKVVAWDSPIPSAKGENVFVAQVDFNEMGKVMADMALSIMGADGGKFAILSASPDAANQNAWIKALNDALKDPKYAKVQLVDTVYGNDQSERSYTQAQALVAKYPDLKVIMAPTTVGIAAAAKAMQDGKMCDKVKVSGLGLLTRSPGPPSAGPGRVRAEKWNAPASTCGCIRAPRPNTTAATRPFGLNSKRRSGMPGSATCPGSGGGPTSGTTRSVNPTRRRLSPSLARPRRT